MLRRRVKKNNLLNKQKIITSRLMQFNLMLDDYIYKGTAMTIDKANSYLEEIKSYRKYYHRDERSLQVIEKLTRCLKGVIIEQNDMKNTNSVATNKEDNLQFEEQTYASIRSNNASPVYSMPDIDKTFYSESQKNHEGVNKNETPENEIPVIDLCEDTDLEQEEVELAENSRPIIPVDIDIQRVLSDMSLGKSNDVRESQTLVENDSQSILENDKHFDKSTQLNNETSLNDELITEICIDHKHNNINGANAINQPPTKVSTKYNHQSCNTLAPEIDTKNDHIETSQPKSLISTNVANTKIKQKIPLIKKMTDDKQEHKIKKKKKQTKKAANNQNALIIKNNVAWIERRIGDADLIIKPLKTEKIPQIKKMTDDKLENKVKKQTKKAVKNQNALINKNNVACIERRIGDADLIITPLKTGASKLKHITENLSWVEEITYVRKVSTSEYDSSFVISDESFWDNCTLPQNWNDQEFVYTI